MKLIATFKTPDALEQTLDTIPQNSSCYHEDTLCEECQIKEDELKEEVKQFLEKYIEWGEYIRIEFDTEAKTARVLEIE